jgi:hypothetical protein
MGEPKAVTSERLDSWKAIAEYLQRDVATVRRWEKSQGLPVRRVPGGRGRSVFAYREEIDEWLQSTDGPAEAAVDPVPASAIADPPPDALMPAAVETVAPPVTPRPPVAATAAPRYKAPWVLAGLVTVAVTVIAWVIGAPSAAESALSVRVENDAFVARSRDGVERWRYVFGADERGVAVNGSKPAIAIRNGDGGFIIGTAQRFAGPEDAPRGGQLLWLQRDGALHHSFEFTDSLDFEAGTYGGPWPITDYAVDNVRTVERVAVAAHHNNWWPSMVTILDADWKRTGTFVNAGWIESVYWVTPERLLISGFSNARDGGMVALLDASALDGQSPTWNPDDHMRCTSCGPGAPLKYLIMPRSELNQVTGSRFNRAILEPLADRMVISTIEIPAEGPDVVVAVYEFTHDLELLSARFGDQYWARHAALERDGRITHNRQNCPDSGGPRKIERWDPQKGWTTQRIERVQ